MTHKCLNCGKEYNPEIYKFPMFGLGPECLKKVYSGELSYDVIRKTSANKSIYGIDFETLLQYLPPANTEHIKKVLYGDEYAFIREDGNLLPEENLRDFLISGSINANNAFFGKIDFIIKSLDGNIEAGEFNEEQIKAAETMKQQFIDVMNHFSDPNWYNHTMVTGDQNDINYRLPHSIHERYLGKIEPKKVLKDYSFHIFDSSARYAFHLARIGQDGAGTSQGLVGCLIQSVYDNFTNDSEISNDFFEISSYMNAETDAEKEATFPGQAIIRDVVITGAYLSTKGGLDRKQAFLDCAEQVRKFLSEDDAFDSTSNEACRYRDGSSWPTVSAPVCMNDFNNVFDPQEEEGIENADCNVQDGLFRPMEGSLKRDYYERTKRDLTYNRPKVLGIGERVNILSMNELTLAIKGKRKITQSSIAPLAIAPDGKQGYFANVIRVKNGKVDSIQPAKSEELMKHKDMLSGSLKAHAALKSTFWKDDSFYEDSVKNGYEYYIATTINDIHGLTSKASYHFGLRVGGKEKAFDDVGMEIGDNAIIGGLTHVWTLDNRSRDHYKKGKYHSTDTSAHKLGQEDVVLDSNFKISDDDREMLDNSKLVGPQIRRELKTKKAGEVYKNAVTGLYGSSGASLVVQANNLKDKISPLSTEFELLKDVEISALGTSSAGYNYDAALIWDEKGIVGDRIVENPYFRDYDDGSNAVSNMIKKIIG